MNDHIKINDVSPRIKYTADGTQTAFTFPFPVFADEDLEVFVDGIAAVPVTEFSISGAGADGGGTAIFSSPPVAGAAVTLVRNLTVERTTDFQESGEFRAKVINDELDKIVAMIQEAEDSIGRSLRLGTTDDTVDLLLPETAERAGRFLAFAGDGTPMVSADAAGHPASAFMVTLLDDPDAATARATLGAEAADAAIAKSDQDETITGDWTFTGTVSGIDDHVARGNTVLNAFEIARIDGLSTFAMVNTVVDEFEDASGVDAAGSTGESYDAVNARYGRATGSTTTYTSGAGNFAVPAEATAVAYEMWGGGGCAARPSGGYFGGGAGGGGYSKGLHPVTPGGTLAYVVAAAQTASAQDGNDSSIGGGAVVAGGGGGSSGNVGTGGIGATENGADGIKDSSATAGSRKGGDAGGVAAGGGSGGGNASGNPSSGFDGTAPGGGGGGGSSGANGGTGARGEVRITPVFELDLISNPITAAAPPSELRMLIDHEEIDSVTVDTDAVVEVSRDNGTTWTAGSLVEVRDAGSGRKVFSSTIDVTAQPSGTDIRMRFRTANAKAQYLHAWAAQADVQLTV